MDMSQIYFLGIDKYYCYFCAMKNENRFKLYLTGWKTCQEF